MLGPPVCSVCNILLDLREEGSWYCPKCEYARMGTLPHNHRNVYPLSNDYTTVKKRTNEFLARSDKASPRWRELIRKRDMSSTSHSRYFYYSDWPFYIFLGLHPYRDGKETGGTADVFFDGRLISRIRIDTTNLQHVLKLSLKALKEKKESLKKFLRRQ